MRFCVRALTLLGSCQAPLPASSPHAAYPSAHPAQAAVAAPPRRPRGFWKRAANIDAEVLAWLCANERSCAPTQMPTSAMLRASGAHSLDQALHSSATSLLASAQRLGLTCRQRPPTLAWEPLVAALKAFVAAHGSAGVMPARKLLLSHGRADLYQGIRRFGGMAAVAPRLGLLCRKGPMGCRYRAPKMLTVEQA